MCVWIGKGMCKNLRKWICENLKEKCEESEYVWIKIY